MQRQPPTVFDLAQDPVVRDAIERAWIDSNSHDPQNRREQGGWIYLDMTSGLLSVVRARADDYESIDLNHPPNRKGAFVVGVFHTHPNPSAEGWEPGPSSSDRIMDEEQGVPDIIRADDGLHFSGPESRRGGLTGNPGYP